MTEPSTTYLVGSCKHPMEKGFAAIFAPLGMHPDYVRDGDDSITRYATSEQAERDGRRVLIDAMNSRATHRSKRHGFTKMSASEFAIAMARTGLQRRELARMFGTTDERVQAWIDGLADVPFHMWWALDLLCRHENRERAKAITETFSEKTTPKKKG